jgi:hypothetical protein
MPVALHIITTLARNAARHNRTLECHILGDDDRDLLWCCSRSRVAVRDAMRAHSGDRPARERSAASGGASREKRGKHGAVGVGDGLGFELVWACISFVCSTKLWRATKSISRPSRLQRRSETAGRRDAIAISFGCCAASYQRRQNAQYKRPTCSRLHTRVAWGDRWATRA